MPLSWNEIKSRALTFSRTWADAASKDSQGKRRGGKKSYRNDAERVAFLFEWSQRITSLLPADKSRRHAKAKP
jgi:hypothetical protein